MVCCIIEWTENRGGANGELECCIGSTIAMRVVQFGSIIPPLVPAFSSRNFHSHSISFAPSNFYNHSQHHLFLRPSVAFFRPKRRHFPIIRVVSKADYYATLDVSRNASLRDIKSSYRKLARKVWFF